MTMRSPHKDLGVVALMVLTVSLLHYNTSMHIHEAHGIYRRLYYFPIIVASFRFGRRGGLLTAVAVCAMYAPHAFGLIGFDPAPNLEKSLEMVLYVAVGLVAGILVDREHAAQMRLRQIADDLQSTLSERDRMAGALIRAERLAAVGRLSAGLAHEIRNPLASIRGSAEVLGDGFPADHPKSRMMSILLDETRRLNEVLSRFLTFARSEPGDIAPFDLTAEARTVVELMAHRPDTPPMSVEAPSGPVLALGNGEQIRQVILNLTLNAATAAGAQGQVTVKVARAKGTARCMVCDSGPGFTAEALTNFGTPFYSDRAGGTGLGLATSLRLVEDLGGSLGVDEGHAEGACVVLSLPPAAETGAPS